MKINKYKIIREVIVNNQNTKEKITSKNKLSKLQKHTGTIIGDIDKIIHVDWLKEWKEEKNL